MHSVLVGEEGACCTHWQHASGVCERRGGWKHGVTELLECCAVLSSGLAVRCN